MKSIESINLYRLELPLKVPYKLAFGPVTHFDTLIVSVTDASGINATAMGVGTTASGDNTTAMGNFVSTNNKSGSFIIGDNSTSTATNSGDANSFTTRFDGGYSFYSEAP